MTNPTQAVFYHIPKNAGRALKAFATAKLSQTEGEHE